MREEERLGAEVRRSDFLYSFITLLSLTFLISFVFFSIHRLRRRRADRRLHLDPVNVHVCTSLS